MPFPLALIPVIASVVSGIASSVAAGRQNKKTNQANLELAKYQAQANEKFIDKQNLYNSPAMQMSRYDQAGLNPNLIYGQGSSGNQASPARYEAPHVDYRHNVMQIPDILGPFQDFEMKRAQIDNVKAQTESTKTEIGNKLLDRLLTQVNTSRKGFDLEQAKVLAPYNADIKHGQAQSSYTKLLQEFAKLDGMKLNNQLREEALKRAPMQTEIVQQQMLFSQFRNQWMKMGVTSADHYIIRAIARAIGMGEIKFNLPK